MVILSGTKGSTEAKDKKKIAGVLIGLLSFPSFWLMQTKEPFLVWLAIAIPFAFVYPAVYGPQAALFSELFDTRIRYTGPSSQGK